MNEYKCHACGKGMKDADHLPLDPRKFKPEVPVEVVLEIAENLEWWKMTSSDEVREATEKALAERGYGVKP